LNEDLEESRLPPRCCRYCLQSFQPSKFRLDQAVCSQPLCQRRRRNEDHRRRIETDPEYAQVVRDSQRKWRAAHADYQSNYWHSHPEAVEQNRQQQRLRDRKRRLAELVKNNLALDLKQAGAEVYLFGPSVRDLEKNNLASSRLLIFQPVAPASGAWAGS
jgi:hypothetical protein